MRGNRKGGPSHTKNPNKMKNSAIKTIPHLTNETREEMEEKYNGSVKYNYVDFCDKCGRGIKGKPAYYIHLIAPGDVIPYETTDEQINALGVEDMGCYPIGSECVKSYPAEYRVKNNFNH